MKKSKIVLYLQRTKKKKKYILVLYIYLEKVLHTFVTPVTLCEAVFFHTL